MHSITNNTVRTLGIALAALVLLALPFAAPKAHAADFYGDSYDYAVPDFGSSYDYSVPDYGGYSYDYSVPDYSSYDYGSSYDYSVPDYSYMPTYSSPSYGMFGGGFPFGGSSGFSYAPSNTNTNVNTNTNTCTSGSCNTAINAPTTVTVAGGGSTSYPVYTPVYQPVYTPTPSYPIYQTPITYSQPAPYVSLSAVPYTGLDLGPWGTAMYWGFLVLWCLGAAYLIVVKRVQNKVVSGLNAFLFGSTSLTTGGQHKVGTVSTSAPVVKEVASTNKAFAGIDPFIASQINRAAF